MKKGNRILAVLLAVFVVGGIFAHAGEQVYADTLNSESQAKQQALKTVPNATVVQLEKDREDGVVTYEVELIKGNKNYEIIYRASDAKILEYKWEKMSVSKNKKKPIIKKSKCRKKAKSKVKNGQILRIYRTKDDGIDIYKVKMISGSKYYSLKYHARTGALIEYEWERMGY